MILIMASVMMLSSCGAKQQTSEEANASKLRAAQFNPDTVRVVVETTVGNKNFDVFSIEGGTTAYRVVMDFGNLQHGKSSGATIDFSNKTPKPDAAAEKAKAEQERLAKEKLEKEKQEKLAKEKLEKEKQEKLAKEKLEKEKHNNYEEISICSYRSIGNGIS